MIQAEKETFASRNNSANKKVFLSQVHQFITVIHDLVDLISQLYLPLFLAGRKVKDLFLAGTKAKELFLAGGKAKDVKHGIM